MAALILWSVLGALTGGFAKSVFWYEGAHSWTGCVLFGIAGGIAGGALRGAANAFDVSSMGLCLVGAALLLSIYNLIAQRKPQAEIEHRRAA